MRDGRELARYAREPHTFFCSPLLSHGAGGDPILRFFRENEITKGLKTRHHAEQQVSSPINFDLPAAAELRRRR